MKLIIKIVIHGIYWMVFLAFSVLVSVAGKVELQSPGIIDLRPHIIINTVWAVIAFYLFYFYFIRFFERKELVKYLLYSLLASFIITLCLMPVHKLILPTFDVFNINVLLPPVIGTFIIAQCGSLIRGFENWFSNMRLKSELETQNLRNELELLKSQVNPHFLFNTLNNIDSLIYHAPNDASKSLITLSELLRYMIYDTQAEKVPLSKESEYIRRYVELQQLRFKNPNTIRLSVDEFCADDLIAPMLFVPFIENAFKYAYNLGRLPMVDIALTCNQETLKFKCSNTFSSETINNTRTGGVGLENVKRRLALIYPDKHKLSIFKEKDIFTVVLELKL